MKPYTKTLLWSAFFTLVATYSIGLSVWFLYELIRR